MSRLFASVFNKVYDVIRKDWGGKWQVIQLAKWLYTVKSEWKRHPGGNH